MALKLLPILAVVGYDGWHLTFAGIILERGYAVFAKAICCLVGIHPLPAVGTVSAVSHIYPKFRFEYAPHTRAHGLHDTVSGLLMVIGRD